MISGGEPLLLIDKTSAKKYLLFDMTFSDNYTLRTLKLDNKLSYWLQMVQIISKFSNVILDYTIFNISHFGSLILANVRRRFTVKHRNSVSVM